MHHNYVGVTVRLPHNVSYRVHRLVALAFVPNPDNLPQVNHINGIADDNRACNLEWVSAKQNIRHSIRTGLRRNSKLTLSQAWQIRRHAGAGLTTGEIAHFYGVSSESVRLILRGKMYSPEAYGAANDNVLPTESEAALTEAKRIQHENDNTFRPYDKPKTATNTASPHATQRP